MSWLFTAEAIPPAEAGAINYRRFPLRELQLPKRIPKTGLSPTAALFFELLRQ
jgi:hypothetical protein